MPFVANNEFLHGEHMIKESSFALHLLSTWLRFGANFFIFECFVQVIKGSRTTNVHYIGILLQHNSRDLQCKEGIGSFA